MPPFTACVVQTPSYPYDKAGNLQRALDTMETAAAQGASLILFPEMFLTGYLIRNKLEELSESLEDGPALAALSAKAKALSMGVLMGLPLKNPTGKPYNAIVMIDRDGSIAGVQAKTHFFGGEEKMFSPGEALQAFDTSFGRMGILVCYDGEFPETARSLALDGAHPRHGKPHLYPLLQLRRQRKTLPLLRTKRHLPPHWPHPGRSRPGDPRPALCPDRPGRHHRRG